MPTVMASLLNDLARHPTEALVLVLDDYHVIESAEVHAALAFLLDHRPPNVHLVLAGRADPPLPLCPPPGPRRAGRVPRHRPAVHRRRDRRLPQPRRWASTSTAGNVDDAGRAHRGWIAALQLAALSMQGRADVPAASSPASRATTASSSTTWPTRCWSASPTTSAPSCSTTAVLDRLTGAAVRRGTGRAGGAATLDRLERANLFLIPLDDRREWYRYHHLFADVLRARLFDEDPERPRELHRRASAWFELAGQPAQRSATPWPATTRTGRPA